MAFRIAPWWWPVVATVAAFLAPVWLMKSRRYHSERARAERVNKERIERARQLDLPVLDFLELTMLAEWDAEPNFLSEGGFSCLFRSDRGSLRTLYFSARSAVNSSVPVNCYPRSSAIPYLIVCRRPL